MICPTCKEYFKFNPHASYYTENTDGSNLYYCYKSCFPRKQKKKGSPMEVILKNQSLQLEGIQSSTEQTRIYKPKTLDEYIGQKNIKKAVRKTIRIVKEVRPINLFLGGVAGGGKTTLAEIFAQELNANFIYRIPEQLRNMDEILEVLTQIQKSEKLTVFMIDEIHNMSKQLINVLLPILQDFKIGDIQIKPFVCVGATTDMDKLFKKSEAFISRFQQQLTLDKYQPDELEEIIIQYHKKSFSSFPIPIEDFKVIAQNSRGIPRRAISLLTQRIVSDNIKEVLDENNIIDDGLTTTDLSILRVLQEINKPMGASFLSQASGITENDYITIYERYLIERGLVLRSRSGRIITENGKRFLQTI